MANSSKAKKKRGQKDIIRDTVKAAAGDTSAVAGTAAALDEQTMRARSIKDVEGTVRTSSSNAQSTPIDAMKPRADSMSTVELNEMTTKQLLAELEATIPSLKHPDK